MKDDISWFKNQFGIFYSNAYKRWRIDEEKAGKDITGEEYERFRKLYYNEMQCSTTHSGKKIFGTTYNVDIVIEKNNKIIAIEECKASYLDSCFLGRAIQNAAEVFDMCLQKNEDVPYFIISCPTKYSKYDEICEAKFRVYRDDLKCLLKSKFIYLPVCNHDRIPQNEYFKNENVSFNLSDNLIQKQNEFIKNII